MKTKNLVALAIAFLVVALLTTLAVTGVRVGKYIVKPVTDGISRGGDLLGSHYAVYTAAAPAQDAAEEAEADAEEEPKDFAALLDDTINILRRRAVMQSASGVSVTAQGADRIRIEIPTENDSVARELLSSLTAPGHVYFTNSDGATVMEGERVTASGWNYENSTYYVSFWLDEQGTEEFANATAAAIGGSISIYMDGALLNTANISESITTGSASIGFSSYEDAHSLIVALNSGRVEMDLSEVASGTIPAAVSEGRLKTALIALAIALFAAVAVLLVVYKGVGFVSALSLVLTMVLTLYFFGLIPYLQFRFASLFGLIAVAAVKLFCDFELMNRTAAEKPTAFTPKAALAIAFRASIGRIAVYSLVSLALALVMQYLGEAPITAFTSVFAIGSLISLLVTVAFTRPLMGCALDGKASATSSK